MKKRVISVVALLLVVLSVASLAACGGNKIQAGTYKVTEVTGDGAEAISSLKDYITLEVAEDGKAKMIVSMLGQTQETEMEFKDNGKVTLDGSESNYTVDGNKITIESDGYKMVFQK